MIELNINATCILPTSETVDLFKSLTEQFIKNNKIKTKVDDGSYIKIIHAMVEWILESKMCWIRCPTSCYQMIAEEAFSWYDQSIIDDDLSDNFYQTVLDHVDLSLQEMINDVIGGSRWYVWSIKLLGEDMAITNMGDYRALEFERLILTNELDVPDHIRKALGYE